MDTNQDFNVFGQDFTKKTIFSYFWGEGNLFLKYVGYHLHDCNEFMQRGHDP